MRQAKTASPMIIGPTLRFAILLAGVGLLIGCQKSKTAGAEEKSSGFKKVTLELPPPTPYKKYPASAQARMFLSAHSVFIGKVLRAEIQTERSKYRSVEASRWKLAVLPTGRHFRGARLVGEQEIYAPEPDKVEVGKEYVFVLWPSKNPLIVAVPLQISNSPELRHTLDFITSEGSEDDEKIYSKFLEFRKIRAAEQKANCDQRPQSEQTRCLEIVRDIEKM